MIIQKYAFVYEQLDEQYNYLIAKCFKSVRGRKQLKVLCTSKLPGSSYHISLEYIQCSSESWFYKSALPVQLKVQVKE